MPIINPNAPGAHEIGQNATISSGDVEFSGDDEDSNMDQDAASSEDSSDDDSEDSDDTGDAEDDGDGDNTADDEASTDDSERAANLKLPLLRVRANQMHRQFWGSMALVEGTFEDSDLPLHLGDLTFLPQTDSTQFDPAIRKDAYRWIFRGRVQYKKLDGEGKVVERPVVIESCILKIACTPESLPGLVKEIDFYSNKRLRMRFRGNIPKFYGAFQGLLQGVMAQCILLEDVGEDLKKSSMISSVDELAMETRHAFQFPYPELN
ncbi:hypothetical protein EIP91_008826 [Steccherinum ochraceum]|uniref:Uncharacterized protein n=1 Tax=Steccherinum ochraceum TaxID=92696 RepID=A0A4R0RFK0_9APHY|nr:hypothetical protein EIP91_008826 [Steccherinum ochraceum]